MQNITFSVSTFFFALALWTFFMDVVQMSQGYRATTRREFTFLNLGTQIRCSQNRYTDLRSALDQPLLGYVWPLPSKTLTPSSRNFDVLLHSKTWLHPHFFLGYSKDIANFLLRVLTKCLTIPIKIIISICRKLSCLSGCKKSLISCLRYCKKKVVILLFWVIWASLATHT